MIETMVALTILVIIGTAIISLTLTVIASNTSAKLRNQGLGLAEEGLEQTRNYFQTNGFQTLNNQANNKCYPDGTTFVSTAQITCPSPDPALTPLTPPNCRPGTVTGNSVFSRAVWLIQSGGAIKARSLVFWTDRGACRYTEVGTFFYPF